MVRRKGAQYRGGDEEGSRVFPLSCASCPSGMSSWINSSSVQTGGLMVLTHPLLDSVPGASG